ncbi:MAG TPA: DUF6476 family protein [Stellaceae bacterium]|nr:DUF6476 family protein [Stellaceae bacterium]
MRALTVFVVIMGVVIVVGFGVVAAVIAGRMSRGAPVAGTAIAGHSFATSLDLPQGARIAAMTTAPDRLILQLALPDGSSRLVILDLATGARLGSIALKPAR